VTARRDEVADGGGEQGNVKNENRNIRRELKLRSRINESGEKDNMKTHGCVVKLSSKASYIKNRRYKNGSQ
jgi:hypothetical protein